MSDLTDRLRDGKTVPLMEERRKAADEIDKLRKEIALADSMYKLVVLERDEAREYLDAAQRRGEKLHERLTLAESVRAAQVAGLVEGAEKLREDCMKKNQIIIRQGELIKMYQVFVREHNN